MESFGSLVTSQINSEKQWRLELLLESLVILPPPGHPHQADQALVYWKAAVVINDPVFVLRLSKDYVVCFPLF